MAKINKLITKDLITQHGLSDDEYKIERFSGESRIARSSEVLGDVERVFLFRRATMDPKVIEWDGTHLPEALRKFPAGRYAIEPIDQLSPLSEDEECGIMEGLNELDAGRGIPLADVLREIRSSVRKR